MEMGRVRSCVLRLHVDDDEPGRLRGRLTVAGEEGEQIFRDELDLLSLLRTLVHEPPRDGTDREEVES